MEVIFPGLVLATQGYFVYDMHEILINFNKFCCFSLKSPHLVNKRNESKLNESNKKHTCIINKQKTKTALNKNTVIYLENNVQKQECHLLKKKSYLPLFCF